MNPEQFDQIASYFQGRLSEEERRAFEEAIKANTELRADVDTYQKIYMGLKAVAIEKQLEKARDRARASEKEITPTRRLTGWSTWAAAASVVLMLGLGWWIWQYTTLGTNAELTALADQEMTDVRYKAMPFDSLQKLATTTTSPEAREKAEWYVALAYVKRGQKEKAKTVLTKIAEAPQHRYQKKAKELLAKGF